MSAPHRPRRRRSSPTADHPTVPPNPFASAAERLPDAAALALAWTRLSRVRGADAGFSSHWPAEETADRAAARLLIANERAGAITLGAAHRHALAALLRTQRTGPRCTLVADVLVRCAGLTDDERDALYALGDERNLLFLRDALIAAPATPLAYVRRALEDGGSKGLWATASKRADAVRDPVIRALLARSGNPYVVLELTLAAPPEERAAWLARLGQHHQRVAAKALEAGRFDGWDLPENFLTAMLGSDRPEARSALIERLHTIQVGPVTVPAARPALPQQRQRGRR